MALRAFADGALFAEAIGARPPRVLALHGWGRRGSDFLDSLDGLSALAPDLPGFGASPPPADLMGAEGYVTAIEPLLSEFAGPAVVVGHSFGGRVGVCLAARYPDRVSRLILTGVPLLRSAPARKPPFAYRTARRMNRWGILSDERLESEKKKRGSADYRAADGLMRDILVKVVNETYEDQMRQLAMPVDLLWGAEDTEVPLSVAEDSAALIRESGGSVTLRVIDGVGHHTPLRARAELRSLIDEALKQ